MSSCIQLKKRWDCHRCRFPSPQLHYVFMSVEIMEIHKGDQNVRISTSTCGWLCEGGGQRVWVVGDWRRGRFSRRDRWRRGTGRRWGRLGGWCCLDRRRWYFGARTRSNGTWSDFGAGGGGAGGLWRRCDRCAENIGAKKDHQERKIPEKQHLERVYLLRLNRCNDRKISWQKTE